METKKKGFSLVELICVMTIAAIIAVAAAPNVSAYVQNSKLQNYRTALNNLIGELQTQLPENRYWNWEEAHETAEAILRSDAGRTVTETADDVYVLNNVSNDSGVEFKVSLVYEDVTGLNTQKKVTITGECIDFPAVTSEAHECFVNLKGNAVDADGYPMITTLVTSTERGGWKSLQDRIRSYGDWQTWWTDPANSAHNFSGDATFPDQYKHPNTLVVNTTDYAANSVKFIQFRFSYYSSLYTTYDYNSWNHALGDWNKIPRGYMAFPNVDVNNGSGTGAQYDAAKKGSSYHCDNVYVYIGSDSDLDCINFISTDASGNEIYDDDAAMAAHGWVRFDVIFEDSDPFIGKFREYPNPFSEGAKAVRAFKNKYDSTITFGPDGVTPENNTKILYRVNLYNAADAMESSRGWIVVSDSNVYIEPNDAMIYVDNGDIPADTSVCQYNSKVEPHYRPCFNSEINEKVQGYRQTIYLDLAKKGYLPGDELQLVISDVDADMVIDGFARTAEDSWAYSIASNVDRVTNESASFFNKIIYNVTKVDESTVCIAIELTWNIYPYIRINLAGIYNPSGADIDIRFNRTTVNTTKIPVTVTYPMVTINGSEDYTIVTFDWSHCDYIDSTNDSSIKLKFNETLSFDVYDKYFNRLTPVTTNTFIPSLYGDAVMNDKIVHLYCKGVNAADIVYEIEAPEPPAVSGTAITTTTTTTTTTTNTTTSTTTTTTTSETTTSTTTTTTAPATESTTTTTKPTTASTTSTTTTTTEVVTTTTTTTANEDEVIVLEMAEFNQSYDISEYFYANDTGTKIPKQIEIQVVDAVADNRGFEFNIGIEGSYRCDYNQYYYVEKTDTFKTFSSGNCSDDSKIITIDLTNDGDVPYLTKLNDAKMTFTNYYSANDWNNIIFVYVKFIY